jgi:hypothetical protein
MSQYRIVFSPKECRPGCVLLQAMSGGTVPGERFQDLFPSETWLVALTDDMKAYPVDDEQLEQLSRMAAKAVAK